MKDPVPGFEEWRNRSDERVSTGGYWPRLRAPRVLLIATLAYFFQRHIFPSIRWACMG